MHPSSINLNGWEELLELTLNVKLQNHEVPVEMCVEWMIQITN